MCILIFYAEKQLVSAAEDVANKLGGDKAKTTSDLLQKFRKDKAEVEEKNELKSHTNNAKSDVNLMEYMYVYNYIFNKIHKYFS